MKFLAFMRSLLMAPLFPLLTLFCSVVGIIEALIFHNRDFEDSLIQFWAGTTLRMFNIKVIEEGREHIPKTGCVYLFNHTSFFDIFVMAYTLRGLRFGAKIELFSIPFFGKAMRLFGMLPIARANKQEVFKVYNEAKNRGALGEQFALAPEGGRNTEEKLLPFKAGPFVFAINSQIPVVPVVIKNANHILPKGGILPNQKKWQEKVRISYLAPIQVNEYSFETRGQLQEKVYKEMLPYF